MPTNEPVVIIGGGASGLIAAGRAASLGSRVVVLEKMHRPGRKLGLTGKGRCNLTNTSTYTEFLKRFRNGKNFLKPAFSVFFKEDLQEFFRKQGLDLVQERGGRVFPSSQSAIDVVDTLVEWAKSNGAEIITNATLKDFWVENGCIKGVQYVHNPGESSLHYLETSRVILATGGASYPATGSSGDGYILAEKLGHTVNPIYPGLVPLEVQGNICSNLQGLSLKNVELHVYVDTQKKCKSQGEMLFTHFGISGPIVLSLSSYIVSALNSGSSVEISLDLKPALDHKKLDQRLQREIQTNGRKDFRNWLKNLLPNKLIDTCIDATCIPPHKKANKITARERRILRNWLKDFRLRITSARFFSEAIITAGGIKLSQVDPQTMASRIVCGLSFCGEILDIDADTGGFNLQAAFSTGWLAGTYAAK